MQLDSVVFLTRNGKSIMIDLSEVQYFCSYFDSGKDKLIYYFIMHSGRAITVEAPEQVIEKSQCQPLSRNIEEQRTYLFEHIFNSHSKRLRSCDTFSCGWTILNS